MHRTTVVLENRDRLYVKLELQENKSVSFKFDGRSEKTIGFFQSIDIRFYCGMVTIIKAINNCSELRDIYCRVGVTRNDNDSLPHYLLNHFIIRLGRIIEATLCNSTINEFPLWI